MGELNMARFDEERVRDMKSKLLRYGLGTAHAWKSAERAIEDDEFAQMVDWVCEMDATSEKAVDMIAEAREVIYRYQRGEIEEVSKAFDMISWTLKHGPKTEHG